MRNLTHCAAVATIAVTALVMPFGDGRGHAGEGTPTAFRLPQGDQPVDLDPASFTTDIDNRYWPMAPGTRWTYLEVAEDGEELRVVVTVSTETKRLANGITARVVRDTVMSGTRVVEDTVDWYAQDADGNVWYLGEKTAEFTDGKISSRAGSWEAGVDGALPGIAVPAEPTDGMAYRQEYYAGHAEDNGEVLGVQEQVEVAAGRYQQALLTKDTNALEPGINEYKLYAPGVGPVLALGISGGAGREELVEATRVRTKVARAAGTTKLGARYP
jgi:hypothetical protein